MYIFGLDMYESKQQQQAAAAPNEQLMDIEHGIRENISESVKMAKMVRSSKSTARIILCRCVSECE